MSRAIVRAPATRDQADAYRFGLRRLEAALVRGDPVPLHEQIRSQRRAALAGVVLGLLGLCGTGAHALLTAGPDPTPEAAAVEPWAVCEQVGADGRIVGTTVVGGTSTSESMPSRDGLLLAGADGATWLVTAGRRHRVDTGDGKLLAAFGIARHPPRAAGSDLLALLPEGPRLATPEVPGRGGPAPAGLPGRIGDVLVTPRPGGGTRHSVVLASGVQEVPAVPAELLRVASGVAPRQVPAEVLAAAPTVDDLPVGGWPAGPPRLRDAAEAPVVCWTWSAARAPTGAIWAGDADATRIAEGRPAG